MKQSWRTKLGAVSLSVLTLMMGSMAGFFEGLTVLAAESHVTDYSYTIIPLLEPFNEYFYVKTDNPDPSSFRFRDVSSVYYSEAAIDAVTARDDSVFLFADVSYENEATGRVGGGYLFKSFSTDGGQVALQSRIPGRYSWDDTWKDTDITLTLPDLMDETDYLIRTYADQSEFFDNMDAVQNGLRQICLYSGSYIRGTLERTESYWAISDSPYIDQAFYIQSPYSREGNDSLFASVIYPFRYDSVGFPLTMAQVAQRLDSSSAWRWSDDAHYLIHVTCQNETRTYGGSGKGKGQGIDRKDMIRYFSFGDQIPELTLEDSRQLLQAYAALDVPDDLDFDDRLTWKSVWDSVGEGSWVRLLSFAGGAGYAYLYQAGDGSYFNTDDSGDAGGGLYWGGHVGFASDSWVDGRYVDDYENYLPGATFEQHPTSSIILSHVTVPQIRAKAIYVYQPDTDSYDITYEAYSVEETVKTVPFRYDDGKNRWMASYDVFETGCLDADDIYDMVQKGFLDAVYLDMVSLTRKEAEKLRVDRNTNQPPVKGLIYDRTVPAGTPFALTSLSQAEVRLSAVRFVGNGQVKRPAVTVTCQGKVLRENTDYILEYSDKNSRTAGRYTITVRGMGDYYGTVRKAYRIVTPADSLTLKESAVSCQVGESLSLTAVTAPLDAADGITWTSSDQNVVTVSDGVVTGVAKGTATVTAKSINGLTAVCKVSVGLPLRNLSTLSLHTLTLGQRVTVQCLADGGTSPYTYSVYYRRSGASSWTTVQKAKADALVGVTPQTAGNYDIMVIAKDAHGSTVKKTLSLKVNPKLQNTSVLSADTVALGGKIKVRGFARGGDGSYQFAVYYKKVTGSSWSKLRGYSEKNIVYYSPKTAADYVIRVFVKDGTGKVVSKDLILKVTK